MEMMTDLYLDIGVSFQWVLPGDELGLCCLCHSGWDALTRPVPGTGGHLADD